jgi:hypothetical protein
MGLDGRSVLFISYNGMLDPLGQTQVIPYLRELAKRGVRYTLLSFEKPQAFTSEGQRRAAELNQQLLDQGIEWHFLRYHQRPSLPATHFDLVAGIIYASRHLHSIFHTDYAGCCSGSDAADFSLDPTRAVALDAACTRHRFNSA